MNQHTRDRWEKKMAARKKECDDLHAKLEAEHGLAGHPKADRLFGLAWEQGHSAGLHEVANYYADLADLLKGEGAGKLAEENEQLRRLLTHILEAHHLSEVDWNAMREAEGLLGIQKED